MTRSTRKAIAAIGLATGAMASCSLGRQDIPPYGEALIIVDTDLPVPQIAARLRVDMYSSDGTWFESRDIARPNPSDWPTSFSVYSDDMQHDQYGVNLSTSRQDCRSALPLLSYAFALGLEFLFSFGVR